MGYIIIAENKIKQSTRHGNTVFYEYAFYDMAKASVVKLTINEILDIDNSEKLNWLMSAPISCRKCYKAVKNMSTEAMFLPSKYLNGKIVKFIPTLIHFDADKHTLSIISDKTGNISELDFDSYFEFRTQRDLNNEVVLIDPESKECYIPLNRYNLGYKDRDIRLYITGIKAGMQIEYGMSGKIRKILSIWQKDKKESMPPIEANKPKKITTKEKPSIDTKQDIDTKTPDKKDSTVSKDNNIGLNLGMEQTIETPEGVQPIQPSITVEEHIKRVQELENEKLALSKRIEELAGKAEFQYQLREMEIKKAEKDKEEHKEELQKKDRLMEELRLEIGRLGKIIEGKDSEIAGLGDSITELNTKMSKLQVKHDSLVVSNKDKEMEIDKLKASNEVIQELSIYQQILNNAHPYDRLTMPKSIFKNFNYKLIEVIDRTSESSIYLIKIKKDTAGGFIVALLHLSDNSDNCTVQVLGMTDDPSRALEMHIGTIKRNYSAWLRTTKFINPGEKL